MRAKKKKNTKEKSGNEFIITVIIATIFFKQESHMHIFRTKKVIGPHMIIHNSFLVIQFNY